MTDVLSALSAGPGTEFLPIRQLHDSAANHVWLVRRPNGQQAVLRLGRTAPASLDLQREAGYLRQLLHPALPQVLAAFPTPHGYCLVTTAFAGISLATVLQRTGRPLSPGLVLGWAEDVTAALDYIHHGPLPLVHRDLHPGHLVLQIDPDAGRIGNVGLIDLGAAVRLGPHARTDTVGLGTPRLGHLEYAAPEQLLATPPTADPRTDVYGLAAALYRLVTNSGPTHLFTFAPADTLNPAVPAALSEVLQRALRPNPADRYESAAAFGEALAAVRLGLHPSASPPRSGPPPLLTDVELSAEERAALQDPAAAPVSRPDEGPEVVPEVVPDEVPPAASKPESKPIPEQMRLPSRRTRRRPRRRVGSAVWIGVVLLAVAGVWAALHVSGII